MDETYQTKFINKTSKPYSVYEGRDVLDVVQPGRTLTIISIVPTSQYAQWDEITITNQGVKLNARPGFQQPDVRFPLVLLNIDGALIETRVVDGNLIYLPKDIPIHIGVSSLSDPAIYFERLEIVRTHRWVKSENYPGYFQPENQIEDVKILRDSRDLKEIEKLMIEETEKNPDFVAPRLQIDTEEEKEIVFETIFKNEHSKNERDETDQPVSRNMAICHDDGRAFFTLPPEETFLLKSYDPKCLFSRFSEIVFKKDGTIETKENKKWENPYKTFTIELFNRDSRAMQGLTIRDEFNMPQTRNVRQGIPLIVPISPLDGRSIFKRMIYVKRIEKKPNPSFPQYVMDVVVEGWEFVERNEKEKAQILAERERLLEELSKREKDSQILMLKKSEEAFQKEVFRK